jgi:predicted dehydrogenase
LEIDVFGSEGSLAFRHDWGAQDAVTGRILAMRRNEAVPALVPIPTRLTGEFLDMADVSTPVRSCFSRMAAEFVGAVRENRPAEPNFQDGLRVQQVLDAVVTASSERQWVEV